MKNTYYFSHDYHSRHDPKIERLFLTMGYEGIGIYWCLIERLYEQGGYLNLKDIQLYANGDKSLCERIANVVNDFELFIKDETRFWSEGCIRRLQKMVEKREKATISAQKRWGNANAMPKHSEGNAIKESKVKESKGNNKDVSDFFSYFLLKTKKAFRLTDDCKHLIESRLKDGYTIEQLKKAVDNFVADPWEGRKERLDLIYCIGKQRGKPDSLEKWLNSKPKGSVQYV